MNEMNMRRSARLAVKRERGTLPFSYNADDPQGRVLGCAPPQVLRNLPPDWNRWFDEVPTEKPSIRDIYDLLENKEDCCAPMVFLLDTWPALVDEMNQRDRFHGGIWATGCLKRRVAKKRDIGLLCALRTRSCIPITREELPVAVGELRHHWVDMVPGTLQYETAHYLAMAAGLRHPETWDMRRPVETWK